MEGLKPFLEYMLTPSYEIFLIGAIVVLLVPVLVHIYVVHRTPYTTLPAVVLAGPQGGGKTSLLTLLERGDKAALTHTSQTAHCIELTVSTDGQVQSYQEAAKRDAPGKHRKFLLYDTPGHGKLRNLAMEDIRAVETLKAVVFVLDAAALDETLAATAEYLYDVLLTLQKRMSAGKTSKRPNAIDVLIAANKTDLFTALPASLVKSNLEVELGRIRRSKSKGLLDSGVGIDDLDKEENDDWLGEYGAEKFTFNQMREFDIEVDVLGGTVLEGKVDRWWEWISDRV